MRKRIASLFLALLVCMGLTVPAMADVEANQTGLVSGAYTYQVNSDGSATITAFNKNWTYGNHNKLETLNIPASLDGHPVTAIAGYAFTYYMPGGTKHIVIPEGVKRIESDAFVSQYMGGSNEVVSIDVPSTVTYIGDGAFSNQSALRQFTCRSKDVQITGSNVFYGVYDCTFYGYPDSTFQQYVDAMPKTYQKQVTDSNTYTVKWVDTPTNNSFQNLSAASDAKPAAPAFTDVAASAYYSTPVQWAVGKGITTGTTASTFSPNNTCTRAQIITFLYRAAGSPEPKGSGAFSDVAATAYYAKAAQWAAEQGMASGSTFAPNAPCTRMMAVEFMWKQAGSPDADAAAFTDASSPAVDWAVSAGVTTGVTASTFAPDNTCTRAQIVTFLYRAFAD